MHRNGQTKSPKDEDDETQETGGRTCIKSGFGINIVKEKLKELTETRPRLHGNKPRKSEQ